MRYDKIPISNLSISIISMIIAIVLLNITMASQRYSFILTASLVLGLFSIFHSVESFRRGNKLIKIVSAIIMLPFLYILTDFIRRMF